MTAQRPDIELRRKLKGGWYKSYCIIYFKPFRLWLFGKVIIGKKYSSTLESSDNRGNKE